MFFLCHPATGLVAWLGWMLKHYANLTLVGLAHICFHSEPAVIHHALHIIAFQKDNTKGFIRLYTIKNILNEIQQIKRMQGGYENQNIKEGLFTYQYSAFLQVKRIVFNCVFQ